MANISKMKLNNVVYNIKDNISGYTTNTGTVTSVVAGTGLDGGTIQTSGTISLNSATQASLGKADTAYQKPNTGIPASDLAQSYYLASNPNGYQTSSQVQTAINTAIGNAIASAY